MDNTFLKKKILITGSNSRFAKALKKSFFGKNIIYTNRNQLNILDLKSIDRCLDKHSPDYLIHLASLSRPMIVHEEDINSSIDANIIGTANIVKKCCDRNIKLIYFSTNYIYPGKKGNYKENDEINPVNNYAWSKLGGEASVKLYKNSLILRLAMTEYPFVHDKAFTDAKTNFIYREEVIKIFPYLLDEIGIINIGSNITESFFSFAKKSNKNVKPISVKKAINFPKNSSVNIDKLKSILKKKLELTNRENLNKIEYKKKEVFLNFGPSITQVEREIVDDMMRYGWDDFSFVEKFEKNFAEYHNKRFCILTPSIGIAYYLAIISLDLKKGDEIIIPNYSSINLYNQISNLKLKPIIVEINNDLVINLNCLKKKLTKKTKAIIFTDFYVNCPNYKEIKKILKKKKILILEDVLDFLGKKLNKDLAGRLSEISLNDFSLDKTITCGQGGAILTDKKSIYLKVKKLINQNDSKLIIDKKKYNPLLCFPPSNLQAAMIYGQFKRLNNLKIKSKFIFNEYNENLKHKKVKLFGNRKIYMTLTKPNRIKIDSLIKFLKSWKIFCNRTEKPLSLMKYNVKNKKFALSHYIFNNTITLPSHYSLNSIDIKFICKKIELYLNKNFY